MFRDLTPAEARAAGLSGTGQEQKAFLLESLSSARRRAGGLRPDPDASGEHVSKSQLTLGARCWDVFPAGEGTGSVQRMGAKQRARLREAQWGWAP